MVIKDTLSSHRRYTLKGVNSPLRTSRVKAVPSMYEIPRWTANRPNKEIHLANLESHIKSEPVNPLSWLLFFWLGSSLCLGSIEGMDRADKGEYTNTKFSTKFDNRNRRYFYKKEKRDGCHQIKYIKASRKVVP